MYLPVVTKHVVRANVSLGGKSLKLQAWEYASLHSSTICKGEYNCAWKPFNGLQKYNTMITTYMFGDLDIDNLVQLTVDVDRVEVTM